MRMHQLWTCSFLCLTACGGAAEFASSPPGPYPTQQPQTPVQQQPQTPAARDPRMPLPRSNGFVMTESDPFSTFAADVDTASYDILRRSLANGVLPAASEVRIEEYVNYFDYEYPAPEVGDAVPFSISLAASAHVDDTRATKLLRVGIQGATVDEAPDANLVFLVDVSGSMAAPNKLPLVKRVLLEALSELQPTDTVSIVTYAADTRVRLGPTPVHNERAIASVIEALEPSGGTNGASGINLAYEQANIGFLEQGINHVVLCTDGDFNLGVTSPDALVALIEQKRKSGVTLTALGFGERSNDAMMERVSNAGNGIYSVIFNADQAVEYAHERLLSTVIHIAKDMKIQVEFNPERVYAYRLIGYEDRAVADADFRKDAVDGGEVGAGHRVTALYELALSREDLSPSEPAATRGERSADDLAPEVGQDDLVRVKVRWKEPGAATSDAALEVAASLGEDALSNEAEQLDPDARWAIGVARVAEILRGSPFAKRSEVPRLRALLTPLAESDSDRRELVSLLPQLERLTGARP